MNQPAWNIEFYTTENGRCQVTEEFMPSLTAEDRVRVAKRLEMVKQHGPTYDEFSGQLTRDIWELRFTIRAGIVRLFFFYRPGYTIIITHGVCKKAQKAKPADIRLAVRDMNESLARGK
jgi:phage-related protein